MSSNNVLSDIIRQLIRHGPVVIRNDSPSRYFKSVTDVAELLNILVKKSYGGIFNIGSGIGISVRELVGMILKLTGQYKREIIFSRDN